MYSNNKQPWMGGCVNGNWYVRQGPVLRVAWARTMMQTADVDGQVRPAGRAGRQGREKRCAGDRGRVGALWNRAGGRMSLRGRLGGRSRRRDLALEVSRNILWSSEGPG